MTTEDCDSSVVDEAGKLALEIQKLRLEIEELRGKNHWADRTARYVPLITSIILVAGFCFGIYQFTAQQRENQATAERVRQEELAQIYMKTLGNQLAEFYYPIKLRLGMDTKLNEKLTVMRDKNSHKELVRQVEESILLPNMDEISKIILSHAEALTKDPELRRDATDFMNEISIQKSSKLTKKQNGHSPPFTYGVVCEFQIPH